MTLRIISLALLAIACTATASAETLLVAQPLATPAKAKSTNATVRRIAPPTVSETSVSRQADGQLTMNCTQKPNPKAKAAANAAAPVRQP